MTSTSDIGVIGKAFPQDDFRVLRQPAGAERNTETRVRELLQLHMESEGRVSAFFFVECGRAWVCRAENEQGSDAAGRPLSRIEFARVADANHATSSAGLLHDVIREPLAEALARQRDPRKAGCEPSTSPRAREALLALLLGEQIVTVADVREATWLAGVWGNDQPLTLMHTSGRTPWRFAPGVLVVVTPAAPPAAIDRDLSESVGTRAVPNVPGLREIVDPAVRRRLLGIWAGRLPLPDTGLTDAEVTWLLTADVGRASIVARAHSALCRQWLHAGLLKPAEVEFRSSDWIPSDHPAIARALAEEPDGLRRLIACADPTDDVIAEVLRHEMLTAFSWLRSGATEEVPADAGRLLAELARSETLNHVPLAVLTRARRLADSDALCDVWIRALAREGIPADVAIALAGRAGKPVVIGQSAPIQTAAWVPLIAGDVLLEAGVWACSDPAWRRWWAAAVRTHPDLHMRPLVGAAAPFSQSNVAWLIGAVRDREIAASEALATLGRWLRTREPISAADMRALCSACSVVPANGWGDIVQRRVGLNSLEPTIEHRHTLRLLVDASVLSLSDIVADITTGAPVDWLESLVSPSAFALVAAPTPLRITPPVEPPTDWDADLDPLLASAVLSPAFWQRWSGPGMRQALVDWLLARVAALPGGALLERVAAAQRGESRLDDTTLQIVAAGLSREVIVEQLALWARAAADLRAPVLQRLRAAGGHTPAIEWLWNRVSVWSFEAPAPDGLTARELRALLPWLGPVAVLRLAMSTPAPRVFESESALLDALIARLSKGEYAPMPVPSVAVTSARPEWVRRIAAVPGWEAWSSAADIVRNGERV